MRRLKNVPWVILLLAGFVAGSTMESHARIRPTPTSASEIHRQLDLFGEVLQLVRSDYVEKPNDAKLVEGPSESKDKAEAKDVVSEASLHGHLKNEDEAAKGKQEELGSSSYVNPDKAKDTQLVYALDLLHGVDSMTSEAAKKRAEAN